MPHLVVENSATGQYVYISWNLAWGKIFPQAIM
jgi:hypothetical protein